MAKWFRSEEMEYVSLIVNEDAAHGAVNDLGMLGIIQFTDVSREEREGGREGRREGLDGVGCPACIRVV
jgi:vacuolar-type H+-ATPase subunit I/STV1